MNPKFILAVGLAFVAGVVVFSALFSINHSSVENLILQGDCNLSDHPLCEARGNHTYSVSLGLSPRPIPLLKDIEINATVQGLVDVRTAQVSIEGINMYMGIQIIPLAVETTDNAGQEVRLTGKMQLPVCTSSVMEWQATLRIQTENKTYQAAFPFTTTAD
ncbi:MAG: hypothetical protein CSA79_04200 [Thiothrix nivea]|nr:MAG: hypothetical protein CSA79_04200 [Thiothrix nivea]